MAAWLGREALRIKIDKLAVVESHFEVEGVGANSVNTYFSIFAYHLDQRAWSERYRRCSR